VLSTLNNSHPFFDKGFLPEEKAKADETGFVSEGEYEFLRGLPRVQGKYGRKKAKSKAGAYIQPRRPAELGKKKPEQPVLVRKTTTKVHQKLEKRRDH